ncbi:hypothetical protein WA158_002349 [Blastocystis sp. Blastoise]
MEYQVTFTGDSLGLHLKPVDKTSVWFGIAGNNCAAVVNKFLALPNGETSEAEASGQIIVGDLLVAVKTENILKVNYKEVIQLLQNISRPLTLTFRTNRQIPSVIYREQLNHNTVAEIYHTKEGLKKIQEDVHETLNDYFNIKKLREEEGSKDLESAQHKLEEEKIEGEKRIEEELNHKKEKESELNHYNNIRSEEYNKMLKERKIARVKDEEGDLMYFACMGCKSAVEDIKRTISPRVEGKIDIDPSPLLDLIKLIKQYEEIKQLYLFSMNCTEEEKTTIDWKDW